MSALGLQQWFAAARIDLTRLRLQPAGAIVTVCGFLAVTGVLVAVLSIAAGYRATFAGTGSPDVALILGGGADTEIGSNVDVDVLHQAAQMPAVAVDSDGPLLAPESLQTLEVTFKHGGPHAHILLRGVSPAMFRVHPQVRLIRGRNFKPGLNEIIVGAAALQRFNLKLNSTITDDGGHSWTIVGVFKASHTTYGSEAWADVHAIQSAFDQSNHYAAILAKLRSPNDFAAFKSHMEGTAGMHVKVERESTYYAEQSKNLAKVISIAGGIAALLMGIAAVFGAMSTLYTAIANRAGEIAVLRAIGFGRGAVLNAVMLESLALSLAGGIIGAALAYTMFNGFQASTLAASGSISSNTPQVAFAFRVTPTVVAVGVAWALIMGFIGGLFPAIRAARLPVAKALRDT